MNAPATHKNVNALELIRAPGGVQNAAKRGADIAKNLEEGLFRSGINRGKSRGSVGDVGPRALAMCARLGVSGQPGTSRRAPGSRPERGRFLARGLTSRRRA